MVSNDLSKSSIRNRSKSAVTKPTMEAEKLRLGKAYWVALTSVILSFLLVCLFVCLFVCFLLHFLLLQYSVGSFSPVPCFRSLLSAFSLVLFILLVSLQSYRLSSFQL